MRDKKKIQDKNQNSKIDNDSLKKFFEQNTKEILLGKIGDEFKVKFKFIINDLVKLKKEIELTNNLFSEKLEQVNKKVDGLKNKGVIKVDEEITKKSEVGFENYKKLLNHFVEDVEYELSFYKSIVSDGPPKNIRVFKGVDGDYKVHLNLKIHGIKKYIKKTRKDLRISFSRYNFEFEEQDKKLNYLSMYLKNIKK